MPDPAVFTCLSFLTQAVKQEIQLDICYFQFGLTDPLVIQSRTPPIRQILSSVSYIYIYIPELKDCIQEGLLRMLFQLFVYDYYR